MTSWGLYPYQPSQFAAIAAILLFGTSTVIHFVQAIHTKAWSMTMLICGAFMMTIGYVCRKMSVHQPTSAPLYLGQFICIFLAPCLYAATIHMVYGQMVQVVNKSHPSPFSSHSISAMIFVSGDFLLLLLQSIGCGLQSSLMLLAGLYMQLLLSWIFILFVLLVLEKPMGQSESPFDDRSFRRLRYVLSLVSALMAVSCVFRIIGYTGGVFYAYRNEVYMYVLDTTPMFMVQAVFHVYHPGTILAGVKVVEEPGVNLHSVPR